MSIVLLLLCAVLVRLPREAREYVGSKVDVDSGGLLQYTWLLGSEHHLAEVQSPRLHDLRAAGMFEVQMHDLVKRRLNNLHPTTGEAYGPEENQGDGSVEKPLIGHG